MAALRFARYWESRKEIFGNEKYLERMELSGALRDDLAALQSGVFCLLEPDASGRYILFLNVARHALDEYTSDSLVSGYAPVTLCFGQCLTCYILISYA